MALNRYALVTGTRTQACILRCNQPTYASKRLSHSVFCIISHFDFLIVLTMLEFEFERSGNRQQSSLMIDRSSGSMYMKTGGNASNQRGRMLEEYESWSCEYKLLWRFIFLVSVLMSTTKQESDVVGRKDAPQKIGFFTKLKCRFQGRFE